MNFDTLCNQDLRGKIVLIRADLNVPMDGDIVRDDTRIKQVLPCINALRSSGAICCVMSHFGRPKGKIDPSMSLAGVARHLGKITGVSVGLVNGPDTATRQTILQDHTGIVVMENLRFWPGEESNDDDFAKQLAACGDYYVNDAFSASHRAHASIDKITQYLPSVAGRALMAEINAISAIVAAPRPPVMAIIGGSKISTKLAILEHLVSKVSWLVIGGAMANNFLQAQGHSMGASLVEPDMEATTNRIISAANAHNCQIWLPDQLVVARNIHDEQGAHDCHINSIPDDQMALDIGSASIANLCEIVDQCHMVLWNGPLGAFEFKPFDCATNQLAQHIGARCQTGKLYAVAGGGDTLAALNVSGAAHQFSYASSAGGAFLEYIEGRKLPGLQALGLQ